MAGLLGFTTETNHTTVHSEGDRDPPFQAVMVRLTGQQQGTDWQIDSLQVRYEIETTLYWEPNKLIYSKDKAGRILYLSYCHQIPWKYLN